MRKTKLTATIMLIVASMLTSLVPIWAEAADNMAVVDYNFETTLTGTEYIPVTFGTDYDSGAFGVGNLSTKRYGRQRIDGVWNGFTTLNFDNIASGDFAAYAMMNNDTVQDLSGVVDSAKAVFNINAADTVSIENLYFAVLTKGTDGVEFAGVPVTDKAATVSIPLSEFAKQESFLCSTGTGTAIDLSKFCGLGFVRMNVTGDETAPESSGRIFTDRFAVLSLNPIDDLSAEAVNGKVSLTFTNPAITGLKYTIYIEGNDGSQRIAVLYDENFDTDGTSLVWTDTEVEQETTYLYTITLESEAYGLSSVSNTATVIVPEDIGGEEAPADGESSAIVDIDSEDYYWVTSSAWGNQALGGFGEGNIFTMVNSGPYGSARIMKTDLGYDRCFKTPAEAAEKLAHVVDYYVTGYLGLEMTGGPGNSYKECVNAIAAEGGYAVYNLYVDETVDLTNAYFTIGQRWYGNKDVHVFVGVPMNKYITQEDKGKKIKVAVPLDDFKVSNPDTFCRIWKFNWEAEPTQERVDVDLQYFCFMGLMRNCEEGIEKPETSGYVYIEDLKLCKVNPVTELEVRDSTTSKVVLGWEHTDTLVEKYNIYREVNGETELIGSTNLNRYADMTEGEGFEVGNTYTYYVEAVDALGIVSDKVKVSAKIEALGKPRAFKAQNNYSDTDALAVNVTWQPVAYGQVDKYVLYRNGEVYQEFASDVTSFSDENIIYGRDYSYYLCAVNPNGQSSINTEKITVTAACVPAMEGVSYQVSDRDITYSWDANPFAAQYAVKVNDEVYLTTDTSYTVQNFPYYEEINTSIWAINSANAKSIVTELRKFAIEKPTDVVAQTLFDESAGTGFTVNTIGYATAKAVTDKYVVGDKSLLCDFSRKSTEEQKIYLGTKLWDVTNYRNNNSKITFWIYADEEMEFDKLQVGLKGSTSMNWSNTYPTYSMLSLDNYVQTNGKWTYVEIPFGDFSEIGEAVYQGQVYNKPLDLEKLDGLAFAYDNLQSVNGVKFYLDNIRIVKGSDWNITALTDDNGNSITTEISANAKEIKATFSTAIDSNTFTTETVWLEDSAGNILNTYVTCENGACRIKLLEALTQGEEYTLIMKNVKSAEGVGTSFNKTFTANQDEISGDMPTVSDIVPVITSSNSGSTVTVTVSLPQGNTYNVADYAITLSYDKSVLNVNGTNAITLYGLENATASNANGVVTLSGNANGKAISGDLASVKFSVNRATTTTITIGGTADLVNIKSGDTAVADVTASKSITVQKAGNAGGGGGGGGGGSSSGTASREDATVKGEDSVIKTDGEGSIEDLTEKTTFSDINNIMWAKDAILALVEEGVISGYPDGTVKPEKTITREEFTSLLIRTFAFKSENVENPFKDVAKDGWYLEAILTAKDKGIVSGIDSENFGIGSTITREDMCTMIYRAIQSARLVIENKYDLYRFSDEDAISDYAKDAVNALFRYGVISGVSDTEFAPKAEVNRAMAARVLYGVLNLM